MALDEDQVRAQDTVGLVTAIASYKEGQYIAWEWMKRHWAELDGRYGAGGFDWSELVSSVGEFSTAAMLHDVTVNSPHNPTLTLTGTMNWRPSSTHTPCQQRSERCSEQQRRLVQG